MLFSQLSELENLEEMGKENEIETKITFKTSDSEKSFEIKKLF